MTDPKGGNKLALAQTLSSLIQRSAQRFRPHLSPAQWAAILQLLEQIAAALIIIFTGGGNVPPLTLGTPTAPADAQGRPGGPIPPASGTK